MMSSRKQPAMIDLGLRLLDHQMVGQEEQLVGKVDNVVVDEVDGSLIVTGIISGPAGLGPRLGGRTGAWVTAIWARLRKESRPRPLVLEMEHVLHVGSSVQISDWAAQMLAADDSLESWLRLHVISRIPGATRGDDRLSGEPLPSAKSAGRHNETRLRGGSHLVSDLIGAPVRSADGDVVGLILEVTAERAAHSRGGIGPLKVTSIVYGSHFLGAELGYTSEVDQGPRLVSAALKAWHRGDRRVPITDLENIDWDNGIATLTSEPRTTHPHTQSK